MASRHRVKGVFFADYVRMLRAHKGIDWSKRLGPDDLPFLQVFIHPDSWYPMDSFERLGNEIFRSVAGGDLMAVRMWGRLSADQLRAAQPAVVASGDPIESIRRFQVLRSTYFDFDAINVVMLRENDALIEVGYHMGMPAEEAASWQTLGFFQRLLELSGALDVEARFLARAWAEHPRTLLLLEWRLSDQEQLGR